MYAVMNLFLVLEHFRASLFCRRIANATDSIELPLHKPNAAIYLLGFVAS